MYEKEIDWSAFEDPVSTTCYCSCGAVYRSHAKAVMEIVRCVSKIPCPNCGENDSLKRVSTDLESFIIGGKEK
jgi:hypothetical protein